MHPNRDSTEFEERVYSACSMIPEGQVTTYKALAQHIHCGSSQAVGQALKRNPRAPVVPCHRVVRTDLNLGGFAGQRSGSEIERKRNLLLNEGVAVDENNQVDPAHLYLFCEGQS